MVAVSRHVRVSWEVYIVVIEKFRSWNSLLSRCCFVRRGFRDWSFGLVVVFDGLWWDFPEY